MAYEHPCSQVKSQLKSSYVVIGPQHIPVCASASEDFYFALYKCAHYYYYYSLPTVIAGFEDGRNSVGEGKMTIKDEAKVASRVVLSELCILSSCFLSPMSIQSWS